MMLMSSWWLNHRILTGCWQEIRFVREVRKLYLSNIDSWWVLVVDWVIVLEYIGVAVAEYWGSVAASGSLCDGLRGWVSFLLLGLLASGHMFFTRVRVIFNLRRT